MIYAKFGLDWQWVRDAREGGVQRRRAPRPAQGEHQHLPRADQDAAECRHHHRAHRAVYAVWVDMEELKAEGDGIPGDVVAEEMLVVLREINAKRRRIGAKDVIGGLALKFAFSCGLVLSGSATSPESITSRCGAGHVCRWRKGFGPGSFTNSTGSAGSVTKQSHLAWSAAPSRAVASADHGVSTGVLRRSR